MEKEELIKKACYLISANLGEVTSEYYQDFYQKIDEPMIIKSVEELLVELVGPDNARAQLSMQGINIINKQ
jgi:hypothetical protein